MGQKQFGVQQKRRKSMPFQDRPGTISRVSQYFTGAEASELFREFLKDHPTGIIDEEEFIEAYSMFFTFGNSRPIATHIFRAIDQNRNGFITFGEYITVLGITKRGSADEKLRFAFLVYDLDGNGVISLEEFREIREALEALSPKTKRRRSSVPGVMCSSCRCAMTETDTAYNSRSPSVTGDYRDTESISPVGMRRGAPPTLMRQRSMSVDYGLDRPSLIQQGSWPTTTTSATSYSTLQHLQPLSRIPESDEAIINNKYRISPVSSLSQSPSPHSSFNDDCAISSRRSTLISMHNSQQSRMSIVSMSSRAPMINVVADPIADLFDEIDENGDGMLTFDEFKAAAMRDPNLMRLVDISGA